MLNSKDIDWFSCELAATIEATGGEAKPQVVAMMVADFRTYTKHELREALHRLRQSGEKLTPKTLLDQLDALHGRLGADEAFALVLQAQDEAQTVVWTDEVVQAWTAIAPMMRGRDQVGARMAFKQAYERIVQDARVMRKKPEPVVSIGADPELRYVAVTRAYEQGALPLALAQAALDGVADFDSKANSFVMPGKPEPVQQLSLPAPTGLAAILVQGPTVSSVLPKNVAEHIQQARAAAKRAADKAQRRKMAIARLERMKLAKRKREAAEAAMRYAQGGAQQ